MGYDHYTRTDIQTSDPRAVVVLLYEGAIRFLQKAGEALDRSDRNEMSEHLLKAQKIVHFLSSSLNFEQGGPVAKNLSRLYAYLRDTLNEANLRASSAKIQEAVSLLRPLLDAWRTVAQDPAAAAALEARAAAPHVARPVATPAPAPASLREFAITTADESPAEPHLATAYPSTRQPVLAGAYAAGRLRANAAAAANTQPAAVGVAVDAPDPDQEALAATAAAPRAADRKAAGRAAYGLRILA